MQIPYDPSTNPLNNNEWSFPLLEIIHIVGFAIAIGTIFMVDLRLIGIGMRRQLSAQLAQDLAPWTLGGFAAVSHVGTADLVIRPEHVSQQSWLSIQDGGPFGGAHISIHHPSQSGSFRSFACRGHVDRNRFCGAVGFRDCRRHHDRIRIG